MSDRSSDKLAPLLVVGLLVVGGAGAAQYNMSDDPYFMRVIDKIIGAVTRANQEPLETIVKQEPVPQQQITPKSDVLAKPDVGPEPITPQEQDATTDSLVLLGNKADSLAAEGDYQSALIYYRLAARLAENRFGVDHVQTREQYVRLVDAYEQGGFSDVPDIYYEKAGRAPI